MKIVLHNPDYAVEKSSINTNSNVSQPSDDKQNWLEAGRWMVFEDCVEVIRVETVNDVLRNIEYLEEKVLQHNYFCAGWISYESSPAFDKKLAVHQQSDFPLIQFGLFKTCQALTKEVLFETLSNENKTEQDDNLINPNGANDKNMDYLQNLQWHLNSNLSKYSAKINHIKSEIQQGNTYQVNFTLRQYADFSASAWDLFSQMSRQAKYGAFIEDERYILCSASPELFFKKQLDIISAKPMKGTAKRGLSYSQDQKIKDELAASSKNRAENLMIVDMIRNDLSKVAEQGSVKVNKLFELEQYPTVWQMTSTVSAKTHSSLIDILKALFPCASITGAPKNNTMKIIKKLEESPRKVYCGAIGYFYKNQANTINVQFSVPIRTVLVDKTYAQAEYGVGSGIVWDSQADDEYQECLIKSKVLNSKSIFNNESQDFQLLETVLWQAENYTTDDGLSGYYLVQQHFERLRNSADYFQYPYLANVLSEKLIALARKWSRLLKAEHLLQTKRVRILLDKQGDFTVEATDIDSNMVSNLNIDSILKTNRLEPDRLKTNTIKQIKLVKNSIDSDNLWLYHKTTNRNVYNDIVKQYPQYDDVLLVNEQGFITESSIANFFYQLENDATLYTPPISDGLLNGVYRNNLLTHQQVKIRSLHVDEFDRLINAYLANSVRKLYIVQIH